jgi:Activator of aromatic catabolism/Histidine kinase/V4R domain/Histidine kinase-, DNA gyrase B-, and HSP90-like ATPase
VKAIDLLDNLLEQIATEGKVMAHGRRALLIDTASFGTLRTELISLLGQEQAWGAINRFGYLMGHNAARRLRDRYPWDSEREWFSAGPILMNWSGLARVQLNRLDFNRSKGSFLAEIEWTDSYESEQHMYQFGVSQTPVCWTLTGYLSGYFSLAFGQNLLCLETSCVGEGETRCVALVKPIAAWGEAARQSATDLARMEDSRQIQRLNKQLYQQENQAAPRQRTVSGEALEEARFQALQNQVNPHFFFNTINIIAKLAFLEGAVETESMAYTLADLMRYSLRSFANGEGLVTLRDEVEHARRYLLIQSTRFRDRLTLHFEIDQSALDIRVPPLSLQPIIENAFVHGLEPSERPGQFLLSVQKAREYIVIGVQDNGVGMSSEQVYKLLADEESADAVGPEKTPGLGLPQVRGRLRYYYGETCQLVIESEVGSGTTVRLMLPLSGPVRKP